MTTRAEALILGALVALAPVALVAWLLLVGDIGW